MNHQPLNHAQVNLNSVLAAIVQHQLNVEQPSFDTIADWYLALDKVRLGLIELDASLMPSFVRDVPRVAYGSKE
jgi:hypothetical protein